MAFLDFHLVINECGLPKQYYPPADLLVNTLSTGSGRHFLMASNRVVDVSAEDLAIIKGLVGKNRRCKRDHRSVYVPLRKPFYTSNFPYRIDTVQLKGVYFSEKAERKIYDGIGVCPEYYYADRAGKLLKLSQDPWNKQPTIVIDGARVGLEAYGAMDFGEALKEFYFTCKIFDNPIADVCVKVPIAIGVFPNSVYDGCYLGFEVLGTNAEKIKRTRDYVSCIYSPTEAHSLDIFRFIINKRAHFLRTMHDESYLCPFPTLDNTQVEKGGSCVMLHDIGDSRFLHKDFNKLTDTQFLAEKISNFIYITRPDRALLPGAPYFNRSIRYIRRNYPAFLEATIEGYFGSKDPYVYERFENDAVQSVVATLCTRGVHKLDSSLLSAFK
ncbi:TPA: hypothetical protein DCY43_02135 [candidate division WWE3 bacterium]|uniref:Uncharacterized protein n=2 Tax=Katanobacteria TaxID=422282 RepID=A0A351JTB0_UNCKA|nr:hypothetical protein [candidate division WWE3 bacterium]